MKLSFVKGDATLPIVGLGPKALVHICNDRGGWGKGFVLAVSKRWKQPEQAYRQWYAQRIWEGVAFELGASQFVNVEPNLHVVNMIAQTGYGKNNQNLHRTSEPDSTPPIRYDALEQCLTTVSAWAVEQGASVHMPRIGTGLAGGKWGDIEPILRRTLMALNVYVYDQ
jgi:O-acetyl-ADP-ribose deacetylase (regulator of RNase III)